MAGICLIWNIMEYLYDHNSQILVSFFITEVTANFLWKKCIGDIQLLHYRKMTKLWNQYQDSFKCFQSILCVIFHFINCSISFFLGRPQWK